MSPSMVLAIFSLVPREKGEEHGEKFSAPLDAFRCTGGSVVSTILPLVVHARTHTLTHTSIR